MKTALDLALTQPMQELDTTFDKIYCLQLVANFGEQLILNKLQCTLLVLKLH